MQFQHIPAANTVALSKRRGPSFGPLPQHPPPPNLVPRVRGPCRQSSHPAFVWVWLSLNSLPARPTPVPPRCFKARTPQCLPWFWAAFGIQIWPTKGSWAGVGLRFGLSWAGFGFQVWPTRGALGSDSCFNFSSRGAAGLSLGFNFGPRGCLDLIWVSSLAQINIPNIYIYIYIYVAWTFMYNVTFPFVYIQST